MNGGKDKKSRSKSPGSKYNKYKTLNEFKGKVYSCVAFSDARQQMLKFYTGTSSDMWFFNEVCKKLEFLVTHPAGVQFLYNVVHKTEHVNDLFMSKMKKNYKQLSLYNSGCRLIYDLFLTFDYELQQKIAKFCLNKFMYMKHSEFFLLTSKVIQAFPIPREDFKYVAQFSYYRTNPGAAIVGRTLIELGDPTISAPLKSEVLRNAIAAIEDPNLMTLIISVIYSEPMATKKIIFEKYQDKMQDMVLHSFQWKVIHALICTLPMKLKVYIAKNIAYIVNKCKNTVIPPHLDILTRFALEMIDRSSRLEILKDLNFVYKNPSFPDTTNYMNDLSNAIKLSSLQGEEGI